MNLPQIFWRMQKGCKLCCEYSKCYLSEEVRKCYEKKNKVWIFIHFSANVAMYVGFSYIILLCVNVSFETRVNA